MFGKQAVAALLVLLLAFPVWATLPENNIIGNVTRSEFAMVRGTELATGSTILSGDTVHVNPAGVALISIAGGSQIQISESSQVLFIKDNQQVEFGLESGSLMFRSVEGSPIVAHLADATIQAVGGSAVGLLDFRSATSALIAASKGALEVRTAHDNYAVTLHEGESVSVAVVPDPEPQNRRTRGGGYWGKGHIILLAAAIILTTILIGEILAHLENHQTSQQKCNKISPFTCF